MTYPLNLNTKTKLGLLLFANIMVFFHLPLEQEVLSLGFLLVLVLLAGLSHRFLVYFILYLSCLGLDYFLGTSDFGLLSSVIGFYASTFRRLLPLLMMGGFFMATTNVSDLIYTLRSWRLPHMIVIPLSVLFRFFPTLKTDYQHIRAAMRLRGIAVTNFEMLKHPWQTLEYIVMPLLMSATVTATDLSAASLTRGLTNPSKQTSIYAHKLKFADYFVLLSASLMTVLRGV